MAVVERGADGADDRDRVRGDRQAVLRRLTPVPQDPLLDHLEKTFAEAYRKEIDQEENVWRSLPFFAATLALQLASIGQVREWLRDLDGLLFVLAAALLGLAALATFAAILFLALSVWPAEFQ